jgi:GGDEF domain-containing protein
LARVQAATPDGTTCSAGLALWDGAETSVELFHRADQALYTAKQSGSDQSALVTQS